MTAMEKRVFRVSARRAVSVVLPAPTGPPIPMRRGPLRVVMTEKASVAGFRGAGMRYPTGMHYYKGRVPRPRLSLARSSGRGGTGLRARLVLRSDPVDISAPPQGSGSQRSSADKEPPHHIRRSLGVLPHAPALRAAPHPAGSGPRPHWSYAQRPSLVAALRAVVPASTRRRALPHQARGYPHTFRRDKPARETRRQPAPSREPAHPPSRAAGCPRHAPPLASSRFQARANTRSFQADSLATAIATASRGRGQWACALAPWSCPWVRPWPYAPPSGVKGARAGSIVAPRCSSI